LLESESQHSASVECISRIQREINERMRSTLLSWLIEVHLKFKLLLETLYITVNLIDRYTE